MKKTTLAFMVVLLTLAACQRGPSPTVASREDTVAVAQAGAPLINALTNDDIPENPQPGETYVLQVDMDRPQDVLWGFGWCTRTQLLLDQNWENMDFGFKVNGASVRLDQFIQTTQIDIGLACRRYVVALTDWPAGDHVLTTEVTYKTQLDDGFYEYPRGKFVIEHHVVVGE